MNYITIRCLTPRYAEHGHCDWVIVDVPTRYWHLIRQYAGYGTDGWITRTEYQTWLQLPSVILER